jgi:hypothetical protein
MIIAKHKDGGIYTVHFTGIMKMENGTWQDAVIYQRVSILLKPDEKTDEIYVRSKESFKENFEHLTLQEFESEHGQAYGIVDTFAFRPKFSGIFG